MAAERAAAEGHFPMQFLVATVCVAGVVLAWLAWGTYRSYCVARQARERDMRIEELRGRIMHLDEVLTMSACMGAATGDPRWEARYRQFEPELDAAIKEAIRLAPGVQQGQAAASTGKANVLLVGMENRAFDLVRQGRMDEARDVLFSDEYEEQKLIYAAGMAQFADELADASDAALHAHQRRTLMDIAFVAFAFPVLVIGCVIALRAMHRRHVALEALTSSLDRKVLERTQELDASRADALKRVYEAQDARATAVEAETALRESETQFRSMVANIPGAVYRCACDEHWTMEFLSDNIEELSGYPASDFLQNRVRSYASIIHAEDRDIVEATVLYGVERHRPYVLDYRVVRADGEVRWVYEKGQGIFGPEGKLLWLDGAIFDTTDRKDAEDALKETLDELAQEFKTVADVQVGLLPESTPDIPGFDIVTYYRPAERAGGDYYDFLPLEDGRYGVLVADVSGHGAPAAVLMAMARMLVHRAGSVGAPERLLAELNAELFEAIPPGQFVTACYGVLDPSDLTFTFACAGHAPPLHVDSNGDASLLVLSEPAPALGILPEAQYPSACARLTRGSLLALFTDGIPEARDSDGIEFGETTLGRVLAENSARGAGPACEGVLTALAQHCDVNVLADDTTLVVLRARP